MRVSDIAVCNPANPSQFFPNDFINYIDTSSVTSGVLDKVQRLTRDFPSRAQREIMTNDILISSVRPVLLHNFFVKSALENMIASTGFVHVRVKDAEEVFPQFLYYFLTAPEQIKRYCRIAESSQSSYPSFNKDVIENLIFPSFDITEQRHIAGIPENMEVSDAA